MVTLNSTDFQPPFGFHHHKYWVTAHKKGHRRDTGAARGRIKNSEGNGERNRRVKGKGEGIERHRSRGVGRERPVNARFS